MKLENIQWSRNNETNVSVVEKVEEILSVKFPSIYVDIVTKHNGAQPKVLNENGEWKFGLIKINLKHFESIGFSFLEYAHNGNEDWNYVVSVHKSFKDTLPDSKKIIPFADDGGGNHLYFDFRKDENNPSIVFQDHEEAISAEDLSERDLKKRPLEEWLEMSLIPVADSFEELLEKLYPRPY